MYGDPDRSRDVPVVLPVSAQVDPRLVREAQECWPWVLGMLALTGVALVACAENFLRHLFHVGSGSTAGYESWVYGPLQTGLFGVVGLSLAAVVPLSIPFVRTRSRSVVVSVVGIVSLAGVTAGAVEGYARYHLTGELARAEAAVTVSGARPAGPAVGGRGEPDYEGTTVPQVSRAWSVPGGHEDRACAAVAGTTAATTNVGRHWTSTGACSYTRIEGRVRVTLQARQTEVVSGPWQVVVSAGPAD